MKKLGTGLFLIGFALFVAAAGLGGYHFDDDALADLLAGGALQERHRQALVDELPELAGVEYRSVFSFLHQVDARIDAANAALGDADRIWDYDRGQYKLAIARAAGTGLPVDHTAAFFWVAVVGACLGAIVSFLPALAEPAGVRNDGVYQRSMTARGWLGIATGSFLIGFYVVLYFYPALVTHWIRLADPVSFALRGQPADRWFFYGLAVHAWRSR